MNRYIPVFLTLIICFFAIARAVVAQETEKGKRIEMMYLVRNTDAAEIATVLGQFLTDARDVEIVVEPKSNVLLMRAPKDAVERVQSILKELDRMPQMIAIEVWLVLGDAAATKSIDLSSDGSDVLKKLKTLESEKQLKILNHIRLSTLDNQPAIVQVGERARTLQSSNSIPAAARSRFGSGTSRNYAYESIGTIVNVTPRVNGEGSIVMNVQIEKSRLDYGTTNDDESPTPPNTATTTIQTTVRVSNGGAAMLGGLIFTEGEQQAISFAVIRAKTIAAR